MFTKEEQEVLKGLNGRSAIAVQDALIRLEEVQRVFAVFGVEVRSENGRNRSCPIGLGHRPALTLLRQLADDNPRRKVFIEVTIS